MVILKGDLGAGLNTVLNMKRTDNLTAGLFMYNAALMPGTNIQSIPAGNASLKMTDVALSDATGTDIVFTTASPGVYIEQMEALIDVKNIVDERGDLVEIYLREAAGVVRDPYNSIQQRKQENAAKGVSKQMFRCFPVIFSPTEKQLEKAGITENAPVIIYTAYLDWINAGKTFNDIDISGKFSANLQGKTYELKNKGQYGQMSDVYNYITLGLFER